MLYLGNYAYTAKMICDISNGLEFWAHALLTKLNVSTPQVV